ncbi:MAG: LysM peptidoglycan-binding domain-containing protein [Candidatus Methylomirabilales bacterium]
MQWRRSTPFVALLVFVLVVPLHAQAPGPEPRIWAEAPLPVEAWHQVQKSDNLHLLAAYYYGDARQWVRIFETNRHAIKHRNLLEPGQTLRVILSPGWTPLEPYDQWKARVQRMISAVMVPSSEAPEQSPGLPEREGSLDGAVKRTTVVGQADGGDSPQDVWRRARAAVRRKDPHAFFRLFPPDDRALMGFTMVQGANIGISMKAAMQGGDASAAQRELDALLKKHGVKELPKGAPPVNPGDKDAVTRAAREMFDGVDVVALIDDLIALMDKLGFEGGGWNFTQTGNVDAELANLKIEGNRATATLDGKPGKFVKLNGRWYIQPDHKS